MQCPHRWPRAPSRNPDHISTSRAWAACLLLCAAVPMAGFAQSPNARIPEVPDAGRSLREIESTQPEFAPLPDQAPLDDSAARPAPAPSGDPDGGARLHVRAFRLQGNLHVDTDALRGAARRPERQRAGPGRPARGRRPITRYYHDQGYLLARYLPPQEIRDGVVDIAVQEGVYDEIQLDNRSRVSDAVLRRGLSVLRPGDPVHIDNLESRLLRLSDLPGAAVQGTLRAGAHPGSSTLLVNAAPTPLVTGSIDADNFGGYYTGEYRLGGSLDVNNPLRLGDQLSLRLLTSDRKQRYYYAAYQAPVGRPHPPGPERVQHALCAGSRLRNPGSAWQRARHRHLHAAAADHRPPLPPGSAPAIRGPPAARRHRHVLAAPRQAHPPGHRLVVGQRRGQPVRRRPQRRLHSYSHGSCAWKPKPSASATAR